MGYDISSHPVDAPFITNTLIPYIMGKDLDMSGFVDRAVHIAAIRDRAFAWAEGIEMVEREIFTRQRAAALPPKRPEPKGLLARIIGRAISTTRGNDDARPIFTGLPGFDSDLSVWGRPFLIIGDDNEESLNSVEAYLLLPDASNASVDSIAQTMIAKLEEYRFKVPPTIEPAVADVLASYYPIANHITERP